MEISIALLLFVSAIAIGVFAVVFGGTLFLSLPLFQILFPEMSLAALIGNIKLGSIVRNATALIPLWQHVSTTILPLGVVLLTGSLAGALFVTSVTPLWIPIVLTLGWFISERATHLNIPTSVTWLIALGIGFYGGVLGAGIMLLLVALLQTKYELLVARANAVALELAISCVAVLVFVAFDLINWPVAAIWATGGIIGGYVGGALLARSGTFTPNAQHWLLRIAFLIALLVALLQL